jgi:hypothetical protein
LLADLSARYEVPMHMHLVETVYQKEYARRPRRPYRTRLYRRFGFLGSRLILAHGVWLNINAKAEGIRNRRRARGEAKRSIKRDHNQVTAHAKETTHREHSKWLLAVGAHEEVVNLTDGFVVGVADAAADDLGRPIARRQALHIDLGDLDRLGRDLRCCAAGEKGHTDR